MPFTEMKDGARVYYEDRGSGEKYIFTARKHIDKYASIAEQLAEMGYHVIDICIRGFGPSTRIENGQFENVTDVWAEDVCEIARQLGVKKFAYTGMSHGGGIGWNILYNHPEVLLALVPIVSPPSLAGKKEKLKNSPAGRAASIACAYDEELWKAKCQKSYDSGMAEIPEYLPEEWKERIRKCVEERLQANLDEDMLERTLGFDGKPKFETQEAFREWLKGLRLPILMMGGMRDPLYAPEDILENAGIIQGCGVRIFSDGSHFISRTHTLEIAYEIDGFFKARRVF